MNKTFEDIFTDQLFYLWVKQQNCFSQTPVSTKKIHVIFKRCHKQGQCEFCPTPDNLTIIGQKFGPIHIHPYKYNIEHVLNQYIIINADVVIFQFHLKRSVYLHMNVHIYKNSVPVEWMISKPTLPGETPICISVYRSDQFNIIYAKKGLC